MPSRQGIPEDGYLASDFPENVPKESTIYDDLWHEGAHGILAQLARVYRAA